jgi:hypothetical protein
MEMACARIEAKAAAVSKENQLLSRSKLIKASQKGCPGKVKQRLERAVDWLVQEKKLLKLKHGRYFLFLHAAAVQAGPVQAETEEQAAAPHTAPVQNEERTPAPHTAPVQPQTGEQAAAIHTEETGNLPELDRETVLAAYRKVRQRTGFSSVEIYNLQQELGAPMDALKAFLLEESRQGGAVLSMGDWSLSSEETRSGAVELHGSQYLLVRFKDA